MALSSSWDGSNIYEDHVEFLRRTRRLPGENFVRVRQASVREISPAPEEGERVIFRSHCLRGFGLRRADSFEPSLNSTTSNRITSRPTR